MNFSLTVIGQILAENQQHILDAVEYKFPYFGMHSRWALLLTAAVLGLAMTTVLGCCYLVRHRSKIKPDAEIEHENLVRTMRDVVARLDVSVAALHQAQRARNDANYNAPRVPHSTCHIQDLKGSSAMESSIPDKQMAAAKVGISIAGHADTCDEATSQTGQTALDTTIDAMAATCDGALIKLADNMGNLGYLTQLLAKERLALSNSALAPSPAMTAQGVTGETWRYLTFALGNEAFAVNALSVVSVVVADQLFVNTGVSLKIRRAIKLRGMLVPVIDLGALFDLKPIKIAPRTRIVIIELRSSEHLQVIGIAVDVVGIVLEISPAAIEPPAAIESQVRHACTIGRAKVGEHYVTLLDIGREGLVNGLVAPHSAEPSPSVDRSLEVLPDG
ncbi:chemotaxis protein CheW (plasmid) [Pseudomonas sp. BYT-5]|uniref:chemotaxis protein CheW n=1 Tax=unclassified Pseudomonas TaxID=196821 RepID=UPI00202178A9|nr:MULTISPECIES: chemotaxis protein CheW [unclassified Pseudomonas]URD45492.1 chemotaxis protein CheW [Pseudomonas sp. BYT-5]URL00681.1 chemotaxis protein CheW [Pseudomonas sp. BYT-1]